MKKYLAILILSLISLFASRVSAYTAPPKPDNGWYIVDQAAKLTEDQIKQLNLKLDNISKSTANEYGALIVSSLNGETIEEVAQTTFRSWGIGKKDLNNGVLVVISVSDRKSRIHTGKGVEGDLPDLLCNDILKKNLNPHLKSGDFYGGLNETFGVLASTIESRHAKVAGKSANNATNPSPNTTSNVNENSANGGFVFAIMLAVLLVGFLVWYFISENQKQEKEYRRLREEQEELLRKKRYAKEREQLQERERERLRKESEAKAALEKECARQKRVEAERIARDKADKEEKEYHQKIKDMHSSYVNPIEVTKNHSHTIRPVKPVIKVDRAANVDMAKKPQPIIHSSSNDVNYHHLDKPKRDEESERLAKAKRAREESENYYRRQQQERDAEDRRRRDREEEDRRRRDREEEDRRRSSYSSSSSSSSSYDSGSSWGGGGFGGGDSGGGGSSSDW